MFNNSLVVQSAVSSFNNAALLAPDFFWSAIMALPIFAVFWIFAKEIAARFMPDAKTRVGMVASFSILVIAIWTLTHQNFGALRDFSWVGVLTAVLLCACAVFFFRRYYESGFRVSKYLKWNEKWKSRADMAVPAVIVIIAGLCGEHTWAGILLQAGAVAIGWAAGFLLYRKNAKQIAPTMLSAALMFLITYGLVMQPEFFRFGQLGRLTGIHILFLLAAAAVLAGYLVLNSGFAKPKGFLRPSEYKKVKWFWVAVSVLILFLFAITESALVFLAFALLAAAFTFLYARHRPKKDVPALVVLRDDLWLISVALFGVLTALPVLICAAIVLWRVKKMNNEK